VSSKSKSYSESKEEISDSVLKKTILDHPDTVMKAKSLQILCDRYDVSNEELEGDGLEEFIKDPESFKG